MLQRVLKTVRLPVPVMYVVIYVAAGLLIYSDVITNGIFVFDDFDYIVDNPLIPTLSFFEDMADLRHIGYLSFALNYMLDGYDPYGYHLVNVIIHILNAILVFFFIRLLLNILRGDDKSKAQWDSMVAFSAGLFFLVHPVETQAVSYVTQRFTSLASLFYLSAVLSYLGARWRIEKSRGRIISYALYAVSIASCILAMKTKEISFTLPLMISVLEYLLFRQSVLSRRRFLYLIPVFATMIIIPLSLFGPEYGLLDSGRGVNEITHREKLYDLYERSATDYLFTQFRVTVIYIRLLLLPARQLVVYDLKASHSFFEPAVIVSFMILAMFAWSARYFWIKAGKVSLSRSDEEEAPKYRLVAIGIIWFFITISIESSVIPIKDMIFEHRVYLPSVGFLSAGAVMLLDWARKLLRKYNESVAAWVLIIALAVPLSISTYMRNRIWTDEIIFWDDIVQKTGKAIGYNNRGSAYARVGMFELALRDLSKTIAFFPAANDRMAWENADIMPGNMAKTYMARGSIYRALGDEARARADYDMAKKVMMIR